MSPNIASSHRSLPTDFDFIIGTWRVTHQRLNERMVGCQDWTTFVGDTTTRKVLGGMGNLEDNTLYFPTEIVHAVALRSFCSKSGAWSIWWLDGRSPTSLDKPVVGAFVDGVGQFFADDVLNGTPIRVRFTWYVELPTPRWEQAFSADGGSTWETNWKMEFNRVA